MTSPAAWFGKDQDMDVAAATLIPGLATMEPQRVAGCSDFVP